MTINRSITSRGVSRMGWGTFAAVVISLAGGCTYYERPPSRIVIGGAGTAHYVQGALAYQNGERDRAVSALHQALRENPNLIMARFLLGTVYKDQSEYEAAAKQFQRVVELDPYSYTSHYNLGLMYHLLNRLQEAMSSYMRALELNPVDSKTNMNIGLVYTALGDPEKGLPYVQKAADLDPKSADAQANLGVVLDTLGQYGNAEQAYRRALEQNPDRPEIALNLAGCLMAEKRYRDAVTVYEQVVPKADSTLVRQRYGFALLMAGRTDDAIPQFKMALQQNPRNFQALNGLGDAAMAQFRAGSMLDEKKRAEALEYWRKSLALNGNQPQVAELIKQHSGGAFSP